MPKQPKDMPRYMRELKKELAQYHVSTHDEQIKIQARAFDLIGSLRNNVNHINDVYIDVTDDNTIIRRTALDFIRSFNMHNGQNLNDPILNSLENRIIMHGGRTYQELPAGHINVFREPLNEIFQNREEFLVWINNSQNTKEYISYSLMESVYLSKNKVENTKFLRLLIQNGNDASNLITHLNAEDGPSVLMQIGSDHLSSIMDETTFNDIKSNMPRSLRSIVDNTNSDRLLEYKSGLYNPTHPNIVVSSDPEEVNTALSRAISQHDRPRNAGGTSLENQQIDSEMEVGSFSSYLGPSHPPALSDNTFESVLRDTLHIPLPTPLQELGNAPNNVVRNSSELCSIEYFQNIAGMQTRDIVAVLREFSREVGVEHAHMLQAAKNFLNQEGMLNTNLRHLDVDDGREFIVQEFQLLSMKDAENLQQVLNQLSLAESGSLLNKIQDLEGELETHLSLNNNSRCRRGSEGSVCSIKINPIEEGTLEETASAVTLEEKGIAIEGFADVIMLPLTIVLDKQASDFQKISNGIQEYYTGKVRQAHKLAQTIYDFTKIERLDELKTDIENSKDNIRKFNEALKSIEVTVNKISEISKSMKILHLYKNLKHLSEEELASIKQLEHQFSDKGIRMLLDLNKEFKVIQDIALSTIEKSNTEIIKLIDQFNLILKELDGKPELISSLSSCIKSDDVTKVISASEKFWLYPNSNHVTDSNIKNIISEIIECLKGNRLKEFVEKEGADVSIELLFYDAFNKKIKELFVEDDSEGVVIKILEKVGEVKNIVNDLNTLYIQSENLTQKITKIKEEYKSYFEDFNVNTYVIKVYDEDSYKFLTISLPEHHELNLENLKVQPFIGSDGNLKKVNIVLENTQKFSKDYYDKYINGCEKRTLPVEKYSYDDGSIVLHGSENDKATNSKIQDYFPIIESQNVEVIDYHCLA